MVLREKLFTWCSSRAKDLTTRMPAKRFLHRHHHLSHVFLLALHRLAGAFAKNLNGHDAAGEEDERGQSKFPIHVKENATRLK